MKMTFRWYGADDPVSLAHIRQIPGMTGVVSAIYDIPVGEVWPLARIQALVDEVQAHGLVLEVIESVPVHEDIKRGLPSRDRLIDHYGQTLFNLARAGVKVVCYNFMPVMDWVRSSLRTRLPDGSETLAFDASAIEQSRPQDLALPGWDPSYRSDELQGLIREYASVTQDQLWERLDYFLQRVIPVACSAGIRMAMHPDDPPRPVFGLPRIASCRDDLRRTLDLFDDPAHGLTLCSGSLGASPGNDVPALVREFAGQGRVHFAHLRNVQRGQGGDFHETAHLSACGSLDMAEIVRAYADCGFQGWFRPDHGRMIWGEQGRPGYGLYDRALGAVYLNGLWEGIQKERATANAQPRS